MAQNALKQAVSEGLSALFDIEVEVTLTRAPPGHGDYAWCATQTARELNADATTMASLLADLIRSNSFVMDAQASGPYVNLRSATLFEDALVGNEDQASQAVAGMRVMVEYLSPNTNKPLHLGHVRNGVIGSAVANLLKATGHTVIVANLVNDRGIHICKSMVAWKKFGNGETPQSTGVKGDHFVGCYYVEFEARNKQQEALCAKGEETALMKEANAMLLAWEAGDPEVLALWRKMNGWVYEGFDASYSRYGFSFDAMYYESDLYELGKDIVAEGVDRGIFVRRDDGSIIYRLSVEEFGRNKDGSERSATLLRRDGTSLYLTQDLGTAVRKAADWQLDRSIYVVMSEQNLHFASLFSMLKALGYPWAPSCYHLSYEMVELPEGRMKSREGTVVDADDLADEMKALALEVIRQKDVTALSDEELERRAEVIGLSAIKFYLLGFGANKKVKFDPKKSIAFEGDTGPYCLYTYARARSVLEKAGDTGESPIAIRKLGNEDERDLARELIELPSTVLRAAEGYNPTLLVKGLIALSRAFNRFYKANPILVEDAELRSERLALTRTAAETLKRGLSLLGIETLERM